VIHGGAPTELVVPWPVFTTWQGIVTNWRAIPVQDRIDWVRFGNWKFFHEGPAQRIDDAGGFSVQLPEDMTDPGDVVEFRRGTAGFAAASSPWIDQGTACWSNIRPCAGSDCASCRGSAATDGCCCCANRAATCRGAP
jgi:hypothetical protein